MPVKKQNKKNIPKKNPSTKATLGLSSGRRQGREKKIKAEIKKAVAGLPELLAEQIKFSSPAVTTPAKPIAPVAKPSSNYFPFNKNLTKKETIMAEYQQQKNNRRLLWTGVFFFALIILALWAWNTYIFIGDMNVYRQKNPGLFNQAGTDIKKIMADVNGETDLEKAVNQQKVVDQRKADLEIAKQNVQTALDNLAVESLLNSVASSTINSTTTATTTVKK